MFSDVDLAERLGDLKIEAANPNFPFDVTKQLQPCSIDLRLSEIAWLPTRFRSVDLSDNTPLGPQISKAFKRFRLSSDGYVLQPGAFILGRTYESFTIPTDLVGFLTDRSSLGRLGIMVSSHARLINPGWRGHMPLVIINHSRFSVRIHPYLGVTQLCLFRLETECAKSYGAEGLGSKYIDDEGGPSRYWLDHTISALRENLNLKHSSARAEAFLEAYSKELDDPTRERMVRKLGKFGFVEEPMDFINAFVRSERWRAARTASLGLFISATLGKIFSLLPMLILGADAAVWETVAGGVSFVAVLGLWVYWVQFRTSLSPNELKKIATNLQNR